MRISIVVVAVVLLSGCGLTLPRLGQERMATLPSGAACVNSSECSALEYCIGQPRRCQARFTLGAACQETPECIGVLTCQEQQCKEPPWANKAPVAGTPGASCRDDSQCSETLACVAQRCVERPVATVASQPQPQPVESPPPSAAPPSPATVPTVAQVDGRPAELKKTYSALLQQARSGKLSYLKAARLYKEKFLSIYPEEAPNAVMNEYLAYMAVLGERVDRKKLTDTEAEYELAKKERELEERVAIMRAAAAQAAAARAAEDAAARTAVDQAAARRANEAASAAYLANQAQAEAQRREVEAQQQAILAAALKAQADEARRASAAALYLEGIRLLTPAPPLRQTTCRWFAMNWICN